MQRRKDETKAKRGIPTQTGTPTVQHEGHLEPVYSNPKQGTAASESLHIYIYVCVCVVIYVLHHWQ